MDLPAWKELLSPDETKRRDAVARAVAYIETCSRLGATRFFAIMLPEDPLRPRAENFGRMLESYAEVSTALERAGAALAIEGWPGPGALCCTPETLRALFRELPSPAIGINYDPSHLVRMHIDPLRFLDEFAGRVKHVHGKDAEIDGDRTYTFGTEQEPAFETSRRFGGPFWRYTLPGRGTVPWTSALERLKDAGFQGRISIELEDEHFNGTDSGEQRGFLESRDFLARS